LNWHPEGQQFFRLHTWSVRASAIAGVCCLHLILPTLISILRY